MKIPNPVKKTETKEYCYHDELGACDYHKMYGYCKRYDTSLRTTTALLPVERPKWCTDETFVRVKIEPVVVEDKEYCWLRFEGCSHYHYGGTKDYCRITGEQPKGHFYDGRKWCIERPDECRKLEVE